MWPACCWSPLQRAPAPGQSPRRPGPGPAPEQRLPPPAPPLALTALPWIQRTPPASISPASAPHTSSPSLPPRPSMCWPPCPSRAARRRPAIPATSSAPAWADVDHNGCDTRNDMLHRDLTAVTLKPGTTDCVVLTGVLNDPYTGRRHHISCAATPPAPRSRSTTSWPSATPGRRARSSSARHSGCPFANDPAEPAGGRRPRQPEQERRRRRHLAAAEQVLPVRLRRPPDLGQVQLRALGDPGRARRHGAGSVRLPGRPGAHHPAGTAGERACAGSTGRAARPAQVQMAPAPADTVSYANCAAARAAGAAPIHAGQPGYSGTLDRDGDGVACE